MKKNYYSRQKLKKLLIIFLLSIIIAGCITYKNDYKFYCTKGDPSSIKLIPKKDPFTPIIDSISQYIGVTVTNLKDFSPKVDLNKRRTLIDKITELDNKTFLNLSLLKGYYQAFRTRPCDENAYKDYILNLAKYQEHLISIKDLYLDVKKLTLGSGITGNTASTIIDRISKYLISRND